MKNLKKTEKILKIILLLFVAGMVITGGMLLYYGYGYWSDQKVNAKIKQLAVITTDDSDSSSSTEDDEAGNIAIDFAALSEINPDTIGWLRACGEDIDGPIVQTDDNDYYLTHLFDNSTGKAGCFFADTYSVPAFECPFTVVYGHYRKDGSMFYPLHYYKDQSYYESNPYFTIYTEEGTKVYQIFSVYYGDYEVDFEELYEYGITSEDTDKLQTIFEKAVSKSIYDILATDTGSAISTSFDSAISQGTASIVVLYTCEYSGVNNRMFVFGVNLE